MTQRWDWTDLGYESGFPRGCQFSDVDAAVEFNGRTLFIECKFFDGIGDPDGMEKGQRMFYERELAKDPNKEVLILYGNPVENEPYILHRLRTNTYKDLRGYSAGARRNALKRWIDWAMNVDVPE